MHCYINVSIIRNHKTPKNPNTNHKDCLIIDQSIPAFLLQRDERLRGDGVAVSAQRSHHVDADVCDSNSLTSTYMCPVAAMHYGPFRPDLLNDSSIEELILSEVQI